MTGHVSLPARRHTQVSGRRLFTMFSGIIIMGLGVTMFRFSLMGNDSYTGLVMALGEHWGLAFSQMVILTNCLLFSLQIAVGRRYIGIGTFVNWLGAGTMTDLWTYFLRSHFEIPETMTFRFSMLGIGILVLSFSLALYQGADAGLSPYDFLSVWLSDHFGYRYFICRVATDLLCAGGVLIFGGILGLGTLVCSLGLGPFVHFFEERFVTPFLNGSHKPLSA